MSMQKSIFKKSQWSLNIFENPFTNSKNQKETTKIIKKNQNYNFLKACEQTPACWNLEGVDQTNCVRKKENEPLNKIN